MKNNNLKQALIRLYENKDFELVVVNEFFEKSINRIVLNEDLDNSKVLEQLKARQVLKEFFEQIINSDIIDDVETTN